MNAAQEPTFPAMLVHDDGSITALSDKDTWPCDPDLWHWSDPSDFIVDNGGTRFEQTGLRGMEGRPTEPPGWRAIRQMSAQEFPALVLAHLAAERIDSAAFQRAVAGVSESDLPAFAVRYILNLDASDSSPPSTAVAGQLHPRSFTMGMTFALWLQFVAIGCTAAGSIYIMYAAWITYRQFTPAAAAVPPTVFYLLGGGLLLFIISAWRFSRAVAYYRRFRAEYKAHIEATPET
jgi:hypothetical protein